MAKACFIMHGLIELLLLRRERALFGYFFNRVVFVVEWNLFQLMFRAREGEIFNDFIKFDFLNAFFKQMLNKPELKISFKMRRNTW